MRRFALPTLVACLGYALGSQAFAGPDDAVKYRKAVMNGLAAHTSAIALINFGRVDYPQYLKPHADALADLGAQGKVLFPAGSDSGKTEALPLIWEEQDKFNQLLAKLEKTTAELRDAVTAGDKAATAAAFKAVGETCKSCHDRYRRAE